MQLLQNGKQQFIDQNGLPLANGTVGYYAPGTLNPLPTYQDMAGTIQNTNPITLDSRGQAIIWGSGTYRQIVKDASGVTIWDQIVTSSATTGDLAALGSTTGTGGAASIGFDGGTLPAFFKSKNNRVVDSIGALRTLDRTMYTRAFVTGYYAAGDGGGGAYWYDPSDTTSADNGGTIIVANDGGRWKLETIDLISLKQFGAKGDGTTVDSSAINAAVAWCIANGRTLFVPAGVYIIDTTITIDLSSISATYSTPGKFFSFIGESQSNTVFQFTGTTNVNSFYIKGRFGNFDLLKIEDIRFQRILGAGQIATGLQIDSMAFLSMRRVLFYGWSVGLNLNSVLTSKFEECAFMVNTQHVAAQKGTPNNSAPNLIEWSNCRFQAGVHNGVVITGGVSNKFSTCDFEGNGTQSTGDVVFAYNGTPGDGNVCIDFDGCYFENNAGAADVYINHPAIDLTYSFRNNEFSRISNTRYTTNNIVIDPGLQGAGAPAARTVLEGNAFSEVGTYVSSSSRATVVFGLGSKATYNAHSISEFGNNWPSTSAPQFPVQNQNGLMLHGYQVGLASYALPSLANGASTTTTVGINGSQPGDPVVVSLSNLPSGVICTGQITTAGTAFITFYNVSGGTVGPLSAANLRAAAIKF